MGGRSPRGRRAFYAADPTGAGTKPRKRSINNTHTRVLHCLRASESYGSTGNTYCFSGSCHEALYTLKNKPLGIIVKTQLGLRQYWEVSQLRNPASQTIWT